MKMTHFSILLKTLAFTFFMSAILSCNSNSKKEDKADSSAIATTSATKESMPDSTIQFLITSAATDFHHHQSPKVIDFRNIKVGYTLSSGNEKIYILCGEFLSEEAKENWLKFATIKTSGYEQYLGNQARAFCEEATMVSTGTTDLSTELKNKLAGLHE